jgi:hypothetical protein
MKIIITENRLNNVILKTIDVAYDPKKMYVEPLLDANDNDENALTYRYDDGELVFMVYFEDYFIYGSKLSKKCPLLVINDTGFVHEMDDLFGNKWRPIFIEWFEDNFHTPVKTLDK